MSSAHAHRAIIDFLETRGGTAPAGEVVGHAVERGFAASTVRRAADDLVTKDREGNRFIWSLPTPDERDAEHVEDDASQRAVLEARATDLDIEFDQWTSEEELEALIEDELDPNGLETQPEPPAAAAVEPRDGATRRRPSWH